MFGFLKPVTGETTAEVVKFLVEEVLHTFRIPKTIHSETGRGKAVPGPGPQGSGPGLTEIEVALRMSVHTATGLTPHFVLFAHFHRR